MNAPVVTFQSNSAPYSVISSIDYVQSALGGNFIPVNEGENSSLVFFRIYNNFNGAMSIATMANISVTTYDGVGINSHTAMQSPVSQSWVRIYEHGWGESTNSPGQLTRYDDTDTAIGRSGIDSYSPAYGSDGSVNPYIRAGNNGNGVGFIEFATYAQVPNPAGFNNWQIALGVNYFWVS